MKGLEHEVVLNEVGVVQRRQLSPYCKLLLAFDVYNRVAGQETPCAPNRLHPGDLWGAGYMLADVEDRVAKRIDIATIVINTTTGTFRHFVCKRPPHAICNVSNTPLHVQLAELLKWLFPDLGVVHRGLADALALQVPPENLADLLKDALMAEEKRIGDRGDSEAFWKANFGNAEMVPLSVLQEAMVKKSVSSTQRRGALRLAPRYGFGHVAITVMLCLQHHGVPPDVAFMVVHKLTVHEAYLDDVRSLSRRLLLVDSSATLSVPVGLDYFRSHVLGFFGPMARWDSQWLLEWSEFFVYQFAGCGIHLSPSPTCNGDLLLTIKHHQIGTVKRMPGGGVQVLGSGNTFRTITRLVLYYSLKSKVPVKFCDAKRVMTRGETILSTAKAHLKKSSGAAIVPAFTKALFVHCGVETPSTSEIESHGDLLQSLFDSWTRLETFAGGWSVEEWLVEFCTPSLAWFKEIRQMKEAIVDLELRPMGQVLRGHYTKVNGVGKTVAYCVVYREYYVVQDPSLQSASSALELIHRLKKVE